jgi:hypothetical protein
LLSAVLLFYDYLYQKYDDHCDDDIALMLSRENIAHDMEKIADCGFTDIVVDVRPAGAGGDLLFKNDRCRTGFLPEEIR